MVPRNSYISYSSSTFHPQVILCLFVGLYCTAIHCYIYFCWPRARAIAAARPVTPFGRLQVNSDNSTRRAPDEVWSDHGERLREGFDLMRAAWA